MGDVDWRAYTSWLGDELEEESSDTRSHAIPTEPRRSTRRARQAIDLLGVVGMLISTTAHRYYVICA